VLEGISLTSSRCCWNAEPNCHIKPLDSVWTVFDLISSPILDIKPHICYQNSTPPAINSLSKRSSTLQTRIFHSTLILISKKLSVLIAVQFLAPTSYIKRTSIRSNSCRFGSPTFPIWFYKFLQVNFSPSMSQRFHQRRHISRDTYVTYIDILILICMLYILYIHMQSYIVNTPSGFCQRNLLQMVRGTATTWVVQLQKHCTHRGAKRRGAVSRTSKHRSQQPMAPNFGPKFVQMIQFVFKFNFMLVLGHPEGQCACNESAPGV